MEGKIAKDGEDYKDYEKLPAAERGKHLATLLGQDLAAKRLRRWGDIKGRSLLERWQVCFDVAAKLRGLHNKNELNEQSVEDAFKPLALEFCGNDLKEGPNTWKQFVPQAQDEFNRRCQEFLSAQHDQ